MHGRGAAGHRGSAAHADVCLRGAPRHSITSSSDDNEIVQVPAGPGRTLAG